MAQDGTACRPVPLPCSVGVLVEHNVQNPVDLGFDSPVAPDAVCDEFYALGRKGAVVPADLCGRFPRAHRRGFDPDQSFQFGPIQELLSEGIGHGTEGGDPAGPPRRTPKPSHPHGDETLPCSNPPSWAAEGGKAEYLFWGGAAAFVAQRGS